MAWNEAGGSQIVAAIDAGTNSVHLLVAEASGRSLRPMADEKIFVRLGSAVERGHLGPARDELVAAISHFTDLARDLGAHRIAIVGTEPLRRVADADDVVEEVKRSTGVPLDVLSHEEEGLLTLLGVTLGDQVEHELVVADVGGGSSELVMVGPGRPPLAVGLRLGSARLIERHAEHDPPTSAELDAMRRAAEAVLASAPDATPTEMVAVGGTATNLLPILPLAVEDRCLDHERIESACQQLMAEPSTAAAERYLIHSVRARTLPAGAAILAALLDRYRLDRLTVSDASLREGAAIALARAGLAWRAALPALAGSRPSSAASAK
ncbi:MAG TPA: hypothetical protein VJZ72_11760 [Candidatus Limnocylindrales bacterium]|nr:hypothetical protein [Candidatus Limnocylindrales bacterium]